MKCKNCGTEVKSGKFCNECGAPLTCPSCGVKISAEMRFCNECGARLAPAAPVAPAQEKQERAAQAEPVKPVGGGSGSSRRACAREAG